MKISFLYEELLDRQVIIKMLQHKCDFLPIGRGEVDFIPAYALTSRKDYGWPLELVKDFCYTHMWSDFARRNNELPFLTTWVIPDDRIAEIVSGFLMVGADIKTHDDVITFIC